MRILERPRPLPVGAGRAAPLRIVAAGGGTGLPTVLAGLSAEGTGALGALDLTALVAVSDDGGSSGELRRHYRVPATGDARNCLVALSPRGSPLASLLQRRLDGSGEFPGHAVGNIVLAALAKHLGDFGEALEALSGLLGVRGRILPAVTGDATLVAALADGRLVHGQVTLRATGGRIAAVRLEGPAPAPAHALAAVRDADLVVLGPGSLYSSVLASTLGEGMAAALRRSRATRVWVANLFTEPGETDGYDAADHVVALQRHLGPVLDVVLVPDRAPPAEVVEREAARGSQRIVFEPGELEKLGVGVVRRDLLPSVTSDGAPSGASAPAATASDGGARHDPAKLARALRELVGARRR